VHSPKTHTLENALRKLEAVRRKLVNIFNGSVKWFGIFAINAVGK